MRHRKRSAWRAVLLASAVGTISSPAWAQSWVSGTSGVWSDSLNWSTPPVAGTTTDLTFPASGVQTYVATDDFPGPFTLHGVSFSGGSTGNLTVASGPLSTLLFAGSSPFINNTAFGAVFVDGRATLSTTTTVNAGALAANNTTINAVLQGSGGLFVNNASGGAVALSAGNTFTGGVALNSGRLELGAQTSLGSGNVVANGGVLSSSLAVAPSGTPPFHPFFNNAIVSAFTGLSIGGQNGFTLAGNISGSAGVSLSPTNNLNATWTLSGNNSFTGPLSVNGSTTPGVSSTLVINSPASLGNPSVINLNGAGARLVFVSDSTPITINTPLALGATGGSLGAQNVTTVSNVTYAGNITGSGNLIRTHGGIMTLSGNNTFSGSLTLDDGITAVSSNSNLGGGASTLVLSGGALALNPGFGTSSRNINVAQTGSTIHALGDATFSGVISNVAGQNYVKSGAGNLTLTAANTFTGTTEVNGGQLTAQGAAGRFNNLAATITINSGGVLLLDNTAANPLRMNTGTTISLGGGGVRLIGNPTLNSAIANTGQLIAGSASQSGAGLDTISVTPGATANARLTFGSLNRAGNNGAMMLFTGPALGANTIASNTPNATNISFGAAPTLVNGILPFAIADATGGNGTDFATYLAANGVQPLAVYAPNLTSGATTNAAVNNDATAIGGSTVNSLKLLGGTVDATNNLTIGSGAVLATGASTISGGTITIGTATTNTTTAPTANFFTLADLTISSRITTLLPAVGQNSGIAKSGAGILTLSAPNTYTGPTRILGGTLRLGLNNAIPNLSEIFISPGATLDLNGFSLTAGSLNQTETFATMGNNPHGTVNIGAASLTVGGDTFSTSVNCNITGSGTFSKTGTGIMTVSGNQAFTGSININNGVLVLGTHASDGTGFRNASRINLGTTIVSGDVTLAFDFGLKDGFSVPIVAAPQTGRTATLSFAPGPAGAPGVTFASPIQINTAAFNGLIVDASGGVTLSGLISGTGPLTTITSTSDLANGPDSYALRITGANTYTGATTLAAVSTLWGNAQAFGNVASTIGLGHPNGEDNPEVSSSVGGLTLTRNITVNNSLNGAAAFATIGSQAPAGSATTTYSGNINIAGSRNRLILYSRNSPVAFTGVISGGTAGANVEIGASLGPGMEYTNSSVTLSGANTYAGGTKLVSGALNLGSNTAVGTGALTIGSTGAVGAAEPSIAAVNGSRTLANSTVIGSHFAVNGSNALTFSGPMDLGNAPRRITVNNTALTTISGPLAGTAGTALVKDGPGELMLSSSNTFAGPIAVTGGTFTATATQALGGVFAAAGGATARLSSGGGKVINAPAVYVDTASSSRIDIRDNSLIVDYSGATPFAQVSALVTAGYNNGAWTGPGIASDTAALVSTHAVGIGEATALGYTTFAGQTLVGDAIVMRYTRYGDATLDGLVNLSDYNRLAGNFGTGTRWDQGDFDFNGTVNLLDYNRLAANFGMSAGPDGVVDAGDWAALAAAIPEPSASLFVVVAGSSLVRRRRSR